MRYKYVVPISEGRYLFGLFLTVLFAIGIGAYVFAAIVSVGFLFFLARSPLKVIGIILFLLAIKYWQIAIAAGVVILLVAFLIGLFKPNVTQAPAPKVEPVSDAPLTPESTEAMSKQIAEQNRQRQNEIDANFPRE